MSLPCLVWFGFFFFWRKSPCLSFPSPSSGVSSASHLAPSPSGHFLATLCLGRQRLRWSGLIPALPEPQNLQVRLPTQGLLLGDTLYLPAFWVGAGRKSPGEQQGLSLGGSPSFP